jgi:hypothetical protein
MEKINEEKERKKREEGRETAKVSRTVQHPMDNGASLLFIEARGGVREYKLYSRYTGSSQTCNYKNLCNSACKYGVRYTLPTPAQRCTLLRLLTRIQMASVKF